MKRLLLMLVIAAVALSANATNYYVSTSGNDASAGTSPATAWRTLYKVSTFTFAANDSILLKRGDVFFGAITVNRNNLNYGAYGTGARPVITGFVTLSGWTSVSTGVYKAAVSAKSHLNMVSLNGRPQQIGRYPNVTEANKGYLSYEAATSLSITDNDMPATVNWTGAEIAIRKNGWKIDRGVITNHTGGTFTYRTTMRANGAGTGGSSTAKLGHGYFIQDDIRTLDQFGEWYYDTTARMLNMYFGTAAPSGYNVQVSVIDTLLNINSRSNISVSNIDFQGANLSAVYAYFGDYLTVKNCDFINVGSRAIHFYGCGYVTLDGLNISNCLSTSIQVIASSASNAIVRNCVVRNNGQIAGMGAFFDDSDLKAMYVSVGNTATIEDNIIDTTGASGIQFMGSNVLIQRNYVNYFCNVTHDNGGIYTYANGSDAAPGVIYTNRIVRNNVISNGISAPAGTNSSSPFCAGIYLDGRSMNVLVQDNTIFNSSKNGVHCNNPANITIRGNTFFNNLQDISFMRWGWGSITNLNIKKNVSFPFTNTQRNIYYVNAGLNTPVATTLQANVQSLGSIDSNYYNTYTDGSIQFEIYQTEGGSIMPTAPYSLEGWKAFSGHDAATKKPAPRISPYTINSTVTANLFSNSAFTSNISGVTLFGSSTTATWDNTNKITGGSLRFNFTAPTANRYSLIHSPIGAVSSAKKYILRFKTLGTTANGIVRAYIRKTASPYNNLVPTQAKSFGMSKQTQEFLFDGPTTDAGGSLVIEIEQTSGTTYIDDIEFYEVTATINTIASQVRFEYNASSVAKTVTLGAKYAGVDSTIYNGTITLAPYSSKVLIKVGATDTALVASAGADKNVYLPADSVILTGNITGGGTITAYNWRKLTGPAQFLIQSAGNATTKVSNLVIGTYTFEFSATDNRGVTSRDTLSVNVSTILPVKLSSFSAYKTGDKVNLKWVTESEINVNHYVIERSADGRVFNTIGQVASINSTSQHVYTFVDQMPLQGRSYYRLAMVDNDDTKAYSNIAIINMANRQPFRLENATVTPVSINLTLNADRRQVLNIAAVDAAGRVVMTKQTVLQPGTNTISSQLSALSKSVYYIKLLTDESSVIKTVISE
jgi:parallel beta-helix repeat protein